MKKFVRFREVFVVLVSLLLILLFAYTGLTKLLEGNMFYDTIRNSPIFGGETIAAIAAIVIPVSEIVVALLIVWRRTRLLGLYAALVLMLIFAGYTVALLFFAPSLPCSCGGIVSLLSWKQHLMLVLVFLFLILLSIIGLKPVKIKSYKNE